MNYANIAAMAKSGIAFFSDSEGDFKLITSNGGVEIVGGVEVPRPEESTTIKGFIRAPKVREVDGETIRVTDKLGVFNADVEIRNGNHIVADGEKYIVVEARPIKPTGTVVAYRPILRRVAVHG